MTLKTKSIRAPISPEDGLRICVMRSYDRAKHPEYQETDQHIVELSPSRDLLEALHAGLSWEDYVARFSREVLIPQQDRIRDLARQAIERNITLLCYEETPENCHRRLLALACQMYQPKLELVLG